MSRDRFLGRYHLVGVLFLAGICMYYLYIDPFLAKKMRGNKMKRLISIKLFYFKNLKNEIFFYFKKNTTKNKKIKNMQVKVLKNKKTRHFLRKN